MTPARDGGAILLQVDGDHVRAGAIEPKVGDAVTTDEVRPRPGLERHGTTGGEPGVMGRGELAPDFVELETRRVVGAEVDPERDPLAVAARQ